MVRLNHPRIFILFIAHSFLFAGPAADKTDASHAEAFLFLLL